MCKYIYDNKEYTYEELLEKFQKPLYQLDSTILSNSNRFTKKLVNNDDLPKGMVATGETQTEVYYDKEKDRIVKNRVTDLQKKLFNKTSGASKLNESILSVLQRETGTKLHKYMEDLVYELASEFDNISVNEKRIATIDISDSHKNILRDYMRNLLKEISETQKIIDDKAKVTILPEAIIYDEKSDTAGTIDLLVKYSDNSVSFYDYKFISFKYNFKEKKITSDFIDAVKETSYNLQQGTYKEFLIKNYGVEKIRKSRILPIHVSYETKKKTNKNDKTTYTGNISNIITSGSPLLNQLPVATEMTDNEETNKILSKLYQIKQSLFEKGWQKSNKKYQMYRARYYSIQSTIQEIILNGTADSLFKDKGELSNIINDINNNIDKFSIEEINESLNIVNMYLKLIPAIKSANKMFYSDALNTAKFNLNNKLVEVVRVAIKTKLNLDVDLTEATTALTMYDRNLASLSKIDQPIFKVFYKLIRDAEAKRTLEIKDFIKQVEEEVKLLKDAEGNNIYDKLINPKTKNLYAKFTQELFDEIKERRDLNDESWFKDNYYQTEENIKKYNENKEKYIEQLKLTKADDKFKAKLIIDWENKNDFKKNPTNTYYATLKNEEKYYSQEYKTIMNTPHLKRFYEFYISNMERLLSYIPHDKKIRNNTIPFIKKSLIENRNNLNMTSIGDYFLNSLYTQEDQQEFKQNIDPITGKYQPHIPILYLDYIDDKSLDIGRSLSLFANMVYNYNHSEQIEDIAIGLRNILSENQTIETDFFGNPAKINNILSTTDKVTKDIDTFESFINYYIYGQRIQNKDMLIKINDKNFSMNKTAMSVLKLNAAVRIGLNPMTGIVSSLASNMNALFQGNEGIFYTNKQFLDAQTKFVTRNKSYVNFLNKLGINKTLKDEVQNTSVNMRGVNFDDLFYLTRKPDEIMKANIAYAMSNNYSIIDSKLKKTKAAGNIRDMIDKYDTLSKEEKLEIEKFKRIVENVHSKITGQVSSSDIALYGTTIWGKAIGQFRTWMPRMFEDRFSKLTYNDDIEEFEIGKYRVLAGEIFHKGLMPAVKEVTQLLLEAATFRLFKRTPSKESFDYYYNLYKDKFKNVEDFKSKFEELRLARLKGASLEISIILYFIMGLLLAGGDWEDKEMKEKVVKILDRTLNELSFFLNPNSTYELTKNFLPVLSILNDTTNMLVNTFDEFRDSTIGENSKKDTTPIFSNTVKLIPGLAGLYRFFNIAEGEGVKQGDIDLQFTRNKFKDKE